jgi:PAS domain S-box-containing protein
MDLLLALACLVALITGILAFFPWPMERSEEAAFHAIPLPLKNIAAISMVLVAMGGLFLAWGSAEGARMFAAMASAGAAIGFWQAIILWPTVEAGMEEANLLFATPTPAIAALGAAASYIALSAALILLTFRHPLALAAAANAGSAVAAASAIAAVAYGLANVYAPAVIWKLCLAASASMAMMGAAATARALLVARTIAGFWPTWIPSPVAVGFLTVTASLWMALAWSERSQLVQQTENAAAFLSSVVEQELANQRRDVERLAKSWSETSQEAYLPREASLVWPSLRACKGLGLFDDSWQPLWTVPENDGASLFAEAAFLSQVGTSAASDAHTGGRLIMDGERYFMVREMMASDHQRRWLIVAFSGRDLLESLLRGLSLTGFTTRISDADGSLIELNPSLQPSSFYRVARVKLSSPNPPWQVAVWPTPSFAARQISALPFSVLVLGSLLSVLLAVAASLAQQSHRRAVLLTEIKQGLEHEIVERLRAERSQRRLHQILEATTDFVTIADAAGRVVYMNLAARSFYGLGPSDDLSKRRIETGHVDHDAARLIEEALPRARTEGSWKGEASVLTNGAQTEVPVSEIVLAHFNRRGDVEFYSTVARDISDLKAAEEERRRLQERFLQTQRLESLGALAGGIAHDFNNLLAAVVGFIDLAMLDKALNRPADASLEQARAAAMRAGELTRQMLAYSGKGRFLTEPVDLNRLVEEAANLFHSTLPAGVVLQLFPAKGLPRIRGDTAMLEQVPRHLIANALEACGPGPGCVTVRTSMQHFELPVRLGERDLESGDYVELKVSDDGIGMDSAALARLFEPFFTTKFTGRGLGLAAVQGIVRSHDGVIEVESKLGIGSEFRVLLPAAPSGPKPGETPPHSVASSAASPDSLPTAAPNGKFLVADDEEIVRELAAQILGREGFSVVTAEDGKEAVRLFKEHEGRFAGVLLDQTMPRMTGREACEAIRTVQADARVIITSGYDEHEALASLPDFARPNRFLPKPFSASALIQIVQDLCPPPKPEIFKE